MSAGSSRTAIARGAKTGVNRARGSACGASSKPPGPRTRKPMPPNQSSDMSSSFCVNQSQNSSSSSSEATPLDHTLLGDTSGSSTPTLLSNSATSIVYSPRSDDATCEVSIVNTAQRQHEQSIPPNNDGQSVLDINMGSGGSRWPAENTMTANDSEAEESLDAAGAKNTDLDALELDCSYITASVISNSAQSDVAQEAEDSRHDEEVRCQQGECHYEFSFSKHKIATSRYGLRDSPGPQEPSMSVSASSGDITPVGDSPLPSASHMIGLLKEAEQLLCETQSMAIPLIGDLRAQDVMHQQDLEIDCLSQLASRETGKGVTLVTPGVPLQPSAHVAFHDVAVATLPSRSSTASSARQIECQEKRQFISHRWGGDDLGEQLELICRELDVMVGGCG